MKRITLYSALLGLLSLLTYSCCAVYDDLSDCPQKLCIRFYNQTVCDGKIKVPERLFEHNQNNATIAFYDKTTGQLVETYQSKLKSQDDQWKYMVIPAPQPGQYRMVCWTTDNSKAFTAEGLKAGTTAKQNYWNTVNVDPNKMDAFPKTFFGESDIMVEDHSEEGSYTDSIETNVKLYNYTVNLSVEGLVKEDSYEMKLVIDNAGYDFNGDVNGKEFTYSRTLELMKDEKGNVNPKDPIFGTSFKTLNLNDGTIKSQLIINQTGANAREIYNGDLIQLLKDMVTKNPEFNLDCNDNHTLNIHLKFETHATLVVFINNWNVVYRNVSLGGHN